MNLVINWHFFIFQIDLQCDAKQWKSITEGVSSFEICFVSISLIATSLYCFCCRLQQEIGTLTKKERKF